MGRLVPSYRGKNFVENAFSSPSGICPLIFCHQRNAGAGRPGEFQTDKDILVQYLYLSNLFYGIFVFFRDFLNFFAIMRSMNTIQSIISETIASLYHIEFSGEISPAPKPEF